MDKTPSEILLELAEAYGKTADEWNEVSAINFDREAACLEGAEAIKRVVELESEVAGLKSAIHLRDGYNELLKDEIEKLKSLTEWQPIPADILNGTTAVVAEHWWDRAEFAVYDGPAKVWRTEDGIILNSPTHWLHLPDLLQSKE
jgi:hypothetical protein